MQLALPPVFAGIRLGLWDMIASVCEDTKPVCDHVGGDCAAMTFAPLSFQLQHQQQHHKQKGQYQPHQQHRQHPQSQQLLQQGHHDHGSIETGSGSKPFPGADYFMQSPLAAMSGSNTLASAGHGSVGAHGSGSSGGIHSSGAGQAGGGGGGSGSGGMPGVDAAGILQSHIGHGIMPEVAASLGLMPSGVAGSAGTSPSGGGSTAGHHAQHHNLVHHHHGDDENAFVGSWQIDSSGSSNGNGAPVGAGGSGNGRNSGHSNDGSSSGAAPNSGGGGAGSSSGAATSGAHRVRQRMANLHPLPAGLLRAPKGYMRATPALIKQHKDAAPPYLLSPAANTPRKLAACKASYYGVLAIGARMDLQLERADQYVSRAREALSQCFDEPCIETISAAMLCAYYTCGMSASGDMLRAKLYIGLANEMADGLELSSAAVKRRERTNAFSTDRPGGDVSPVLTSVGGTTGGAAAPEAGSRPNKRRKSGAAAAAAIDGSGSTVDTAPGISSSTPSAARGSGTTAGTLADSGAAPDTLAAALLPDVRSGIPLDLLLTVRFLAQMTSAYRSGIVPAVRGFGGLAGGGGGSNSTATGSAAGSGGGGGGGMDTGNSLSDWDSPRGKVSRILAHVTEKTRRRISTPDQLRKIAPHLLEALNEAAELTSVHHIGGPMEFATQAAIYTSRAVVLHACGEIARALEAADLSLAVMDNDLRLFSAYFTASVFVQLIPIFMSSGRLDRVARVMEFLTDITKMWPVGHILLAKATRRIYYSTVQQQQQQQAHQTHHDSSGGAGGDARHQHHQQQQQALHLDAGVGGVRASASSSNLTPLERFASVTETFGEPALIHDEEGSVDAYTGASGGGGGHGHGIQQHQQNQGSRVVPAATAAAPSPANAQLRPTRTAPADLSAAAGGVDGGSEGVHMHALQQSSGAGTGIAGTGVGGDLGSPLGLMLASGSGAVGTGTGAASLALNNLLPQSSSTPPQLQRSPLPSGASTAGSGLLQYSGQHHQQHQQQQYQQQQPIGSTRVNMRHPMLQSSMDFLSGANGNVNGAASSSLQLAAGAGGRQLSLGIDGLDAGRSTSTGSLGMGQHMNVGRPGQSAGVPAPPPSSSLLPLHGVGFGALGSGSAAAAGGGTMGRTTAGAGMMGGLGWDVDDILGDLDDPFSSYSGPSGYGFMDMPLPSPLGATYQPIAGLQLHTLQLPRSSPSSSNTNGYDSARILQQAGLSASQGQLTPLLLGIGASAPPASQGSNQPGHTPGQLRGW